MAYQNSPAPPATHVGHIYEQVPKLARTNLVKSGPDFPDIGKNLAEPSG